MRSLTAATLIALSAVTLSCTKTQIEPENPKGPAIEFSTKDPWTKAQDKAALEAMRKGSFNVWGWFRGTTNGHVFDATEVYDATYNSETDSFSSITPNWTYAPESPRYWMNGLYDFAAVYPFDTPNVTFNPQTDEEGNTYEVVLETNANGEFVTKENGEKVTAQKPNKVTTTKPQKPGTSTTGSSS